MEELKDIKGIVEVPDYSLWILLSVIICVIFILILLIYFLKNRRKKRKKLTLKQIAMNNSITKVDVAKELLKNVDEKK